jgi:mannose-6-phosphate isomerase
VANPELYPLKFKEIYKPYIWGGRGLEKIGKDLGDHEIVAESWEIADRGADDHRFVDRRSFDHSNEVSIVKNGALAGRSLRELVETFGTDISPVALNGRFPLIVKYIDARDRLSLQVHPDDDYARAHEPPGELGKTECWYVMDAPPGAELIMGLARGMTRERFTGLVGSGRIEEGLNRVQIKRGDVFFIKTGTVHALLENTMVCEILENSDTTYRLHDWARTGKDGMPRPLHVAKALDVIFFPEENEYEDHMRSISISYERARINEEARLVRCPYFNIDYLRLEADFRFTLAHSHFHCLNVLSGRGSVVYEKGSHRGGQSRGAVPSSEELPIGRGETILVPRPVGSYTVKTTGMEILKTFL